MPSKQSKPKAESPLRSILELPPLSRSLEKALALITEANKQMLHNMQKHNEQIDDVLNKQQDSIEVLANEVRRIAIDVLCIQEHLATIHKNTHPNDVAAPSHPANAPGDPPDP